jgi:hypothetical protein
MTSGVRQKMKVWGAASAALAAFVCLPAVGHAQTMSSAQAGQMLTDIRLWNAQLLEAKPALADVETALTGDCREKLPADADFVSYCSCARAVVMYLWLRTDSEQMETLVESYVADPSSMTPADFLKYQGPELYKPFCDLALGTT